MPKMSHYLESSCFIACRTGSDSSGIAARIPWKQYRLGHDLCYWQGSNKTQWRRTRLQTIVEPDTRQRRGAHLHLSADKVSSALYEKFTLPTLRKKPFPFRQNHPDTNNRSSPHNRNNCIFFRKLAMLLSAFLLNNNKHNCKANGKIYQPKSWKSNQIVLIPPIQWIGSKNIRRHCIINTR